MEIKLINIERKKLLILLGCHKVQIITLQKKCSHQIKK